MRWDGVTQGIAGQNYLFKGIVFEALEAEDVEDTDKQHVGHIGFKGTVSGRLGQIESH